MLPEITVTICGILQGEICSVSVTIIDISLKFLILVHEINVSFTVLM